MVDCYSWFVVHTMMNFDSRKSFFWSFKKVSKLDKKSEKISFNVSHETIVEKFTFHVKHFYGIARYKVNYTKTPHQKIIGREL